MNQELTRKFFHLFFGFLFLALIYFLGTTTSFFIILTIFIIGLILGLLIKKGYKNKRIDYLLELVERDHEKHFPGKAALLFFLSALIVLYFFSAEKLIVLTALSVLIFADSAAAIVGKKFGKIYILKNKNYTKTLIGTMSCFLVSFFILLIVAPIEIAFIIALVATLIEFLPINDNLMMPLVVSIMLKLLI